MLGGGGGAAGGGTEGWRCVGGGVVEGWMTDQALRNNYLHKIPSPFSFLWGTERGGIKWQKVKYVEKALVFLLGLAYEELYTWWSTGLMGEDTRIENTLMHTYANPLAVFFMAKEMVK